jgi:mersacidin/lichenicidin family type 2 lantibiotic
MNVTRAWKDPEYRSGLGADVLATVPPHPCGGARLDDELLAAVSGAAPTGDVNSIGCCGDKGGFTRFTCPIGAGTTLGCCERRRPPSTAEPYLGIPC